MKKYLIGTLMAMCLLAFAGCGEKADESGSEALTEVTDNTDSNDTNIEQTESIVEEPQPEEESEVIADASWAAQNAIEFSEPAELTMPWYCYLPLNGEILEDVENEDNAAVYSKPVVTVEENGDMKIYSVTYTADATNTFVVPNSYDRTDPVKGSLHEFLIMDPISGTVIPFFYDGNEYEVSVPQGDDVCVITTSSNVEFETKTNASDSAEGNSDVWLHRYETLYTFSLKITVPADKDDIVLWINRTDCHSDDADSQPIPHIYGDNYDEVKEDCVFIKLSDLVTD